MELTGIALPPGVTALMLVQGFFLLAIAPFAQKANWEAQGRRILGASAAAMIVGGVLMFTSHPAAAPWNLFPVIGAVAAGSGSAMLLLLWGAAFARLGTMSIAINTAIALALSIALHLGITKAVPAVVSPWLEAFLPLFQIPFALASQSEQPVAPPLSASSRIDIAASARFFILLGISMALFGFSLGALGASSVVSINMYNDPASQIIVLVIACICIPLLLCLVLRGNLGKARWDLLLRPLMLIVAVSVLSASVLSPVIPALALFLLYLSTLYMHGSLWMYTVGISYETKLPPLLPVGIGQGALTLGILLGAWVSFDPSLLSAFPQGFSRGVMIATFIAGYTLNPHIPAFTNDAARLGLRRQTDSDEETPLEESPEKLNERQPSAETDEEPANERTEAATTSHETLKEALGAEIDAYRCACESIAHRYLLSSRQTEVLYMLARGHNAAYVQEKLCITHSTAKSHIYRIYRKLNIHTQHELLAMVEQELARPLETSDKEIDE